MGSQNLAPFRQNGFVVKKYAKIGVQILNEAGLFRVW